MESITDWTKFRKRIVINSPLDEVYAAWAKPENLETWFLEEAKYFNKKDQPRQPDELVRKGDRFVWKWNNWDIEEKGEILDENGADQISFTFGAGGNVYIQMLPTASGTEVTLIQDTIPTDEKSKKEIFVGCSTGWTFWMANLKAWLEHGITLHATGLSQEDTADLVNS
ncbi:MAG: SRPBCC domain-containing protein [Bacteroidales bacterium]|nr:SRPBCC domain-containing protein [Bacteroidales bacterium]